MVTRFNDLRGTDPVGGVPLRAQKQDGGRTRTCQFPKRSSCSQLKPCRPAENTSVTLTRLALFVILRRMSRHHGKPVKYRPPRIRVPRQQKAIFTIDNERRLGVVQRLSLTGGSALLTKGPIAEGTLGEMLFATVFGNVKAHIEFLHKGADGVSLAQAFTFVAMDAASTQRLTKALEEMNTSEFSDDVRERTQIDVAFDTLKQSVRQLSGMLNSMRQKRSKR